MKTKILILSLALLSTYMGYGQSKTSSAKQKTLIVYFSRSSHTETIANYIKEATDADILRIEPVEPYSKVDSICGARVNMETVNDSRPAIKTKIENLQDYDVIYVGSPLWQGTITPPVKTLLSSYDFSGKTIIPFTTYGSQGLGRSVDDIKKLCPQSIIIEGHAFKGSSVKNAKNEVVKWVEEIKAAK